MLVCRGARPCRCWERTPSSRRFGNQECSGRGLAMEDALAGLACALEDQPGCAPPKSLAPSAGSDRQGETVLVMVPHSGHVAIDATSEAVCVVTHLITTEKVTFEHGPYEVIYDDDGFGALVLESEGAAGVIHLEDHFRFVVYKNEQTDEFVFAMRGKEKATWIALSHYQGKSTSHEITLCLGPARAETRFDLVAYKWPRHPAARIMWDTKAIYTGLAFTQFNNQQWRWVSGSWRRWQQLMAEDFGMPEHVLPSTLMKECRPHHVCRYSWVPFPRIRSVTP